MRNFVIRLTMFVSLKMNNEVGPDLLISIPAFTRRGNKFALLPTSPCGTVGPFGQLVPDWPLRPGGPLSPAGPGTIPEWSRCIMPGSGTVNL